MRKYIAQSEPSFTIENKSFNFTPWTKLFNPKSTSKTFDPSRQRIKANGIQRQ